MSPAQLRQHAANRFMSDNKQEWCDTAVAYLIEAADRIERVKHESCEALNEYLKKANQHWTLLKPCLDLLAYLDKNPPMGESIYAVRQIREAVAAIMVPVVQHLPADDTEGGAL